MASVEDTTVARSRDISRDDLTGELKRDDTALEMRNMGDGGESRADESVESGQGGEATFSDVVTRYMDSQETLPDSVVRLLEEGDSNKVGREFTSECRRCYFPPPPSSR